MTINDKILDRSNEKDFPVPPNSEDRYIQEPIAIVGVACRLPGNCNSPSELWDFLERGGIASSTDVPKSRFNVDAHHVGGRKPRTMTSPGGMFLNIDPQDFDAQFFGVSPQDAIAMDPQHRQTLEVVYEGLENAGIPVEVLDGAPVGCFVGSYACDYADMQARDPSDRPPNITVGMSRALLSNRISYFLNLKGPSFTIDTACSGSLVAVDVACRYLNTKEINCAIVAAANLYLGPEHTMDHGATNGTASLSGQCYTFDAKADGYIKAEAVNTVILKRLSDAIRDRDPIRAIIRGTATSSDGKTPGIASPDSDAQAAAIRAAYANASSSSFADTQYLECHGTGTAAGGYNSDPIEVSAVANVFAASRPSGHPLIIGSVKSNIGHGEPAAGLSGLLKAILAIEKGIIPGNPTFETLNPKIDLANDNIRIATEVMPWPASAIRQASINSFGFGGSNAHVLLQDVASEVAMTSSNHVSSLITDFDDFFNDDSSDAIPGSPHLLVFSTNDENSLKEYYKSIGKHLINPSVKVQLIDLAYTLSERRSCLFNRGFLVTKVPEIDNRKIVLGQKRANPPRIAFIFTGQGAQWSLMGKALVTNFDIARNILKRLDKILQGLPEPPTWTLFDELTKSQTSDHLRLPHIAQPLLTALQIIIISVLGSWDIIPERVVGHSSGEIAAAYAAGYISMEGAMKVAYYRGIAATEPEDARKPKLGMMACAMSSDEILPYIENFEEHVQIACYNSPKSITLSGHISKLEELKARLEKEGQSPKLLQVNVAYHSNFMAKSAVTYRNLLEAHFGTPKIGEKANIIMFSSVTGTHMDRECNSEYWKDNMVCPVRFNEAATAMFSGEEGADFAIEIGPSKVLAGPINQIKGALPDKGANIQYFPALVRGNIGVDDIFNVAGQIFIAGGRISLLKVNRLVHVSPKVIVDLPNYKWNHSTKYWHESESSKDWRFRQFPYHDLIGSKVLGTAWTAPVFTNTIYVGTLGWLKDHKLGAEIVFPAAGYIAMAVEAVYQTTKTLSIPGDYDFQKVQYHLRNVVLARALVLEESGPGQKVMISLALPFDKTESWHKFKISSLRDDNWTEHCHGLISLENYAAPVSTQPLAALSRVTPFTPWYTAMHNVGMNLGPQFQKQLELEVVAGQRSSRSSVSLVQPTTKYPQSRYPLHPVIIDGCLQSAVPSLWQSQLAGFNHNLVPASIDNLIIYPQVARLEIGLGIGSSKYRGVGSLNAPKNQVSQVAVFEQSTGRKLFEASGLQCVRLEMREDTSTQHSYCTTIWKPDIATVTESQLSTINIHNLESSAEDSIQEVIDLVVHKKPNLKVMEVDVTSYEPFSLWFAEKAKDKSHRAGYRSYLSATSFVNALMSMEEKYQTNRDTTFSLLDLTNSPETFNSAGNDFDLIIVKMGAVSDSFLTHICQNARHQLLPGGQLMLIHNDSPWAPHSPNLSEILEKEMFTKTLKLSDGPDTYGTFTSAYLSQLVSAHELHLKSSRCEGCHKHIEIIHLIEAEEHTRAVQEELATRGWHITSRSRDDPANIEAETTVLVLDELFSHVLSKVSDVQWIRLKTLARQARRLLWVTSGSQMDIKNPESALIHGLARTVRAENPGIQFITLDLESTELSLCANSINLLLESLRYNSVGSEIDTEFAERDGILNVSRVVPDECVNIAEYDDLNGKQLELRAFHESKTCIRLQSERLGTFDSLQYVEVQELDSTAELSDDMVEIEVMAAGLNFKDPAVAMGIVPGNEHYLGFEGAGTVKRFGKAVESYSIGQRVLFVGEGAFANRVVTCKHQVHAIPENLSFEEAASMPSVYTVSIYSLFHLGSLQAKQRVLIHAAAGGVGIAAIQLSQNSGAEVFATVGSDEKRSFLRETFGIPSSHIFSSRKTGFSTELLAATNGQGVDVILNSLTGDMLDESWRCIAYGGTMVEIGKKDILARNSLSMEPFNRNASFRAIDMSNKNFPDTLKHELLAEMMDLFVAGRIKPISPLVVFPVEDIASAFRLLGSGKLIGKIIVSNGDDQAFSVPVRPAKKQLHLSKDASYLIVGGLKGLCGSLAIYLANLGVQNLVILSRGGFDDDKSQRILKGIQNQGAKVDLIVGDVTVLEDVQLAFKSAKLPIGGIIHGAMVLNDTIFESMTSKQFHDTTTSKVQGTWNLHKVSLEQAVPIKSFTMLSSVSGVLGNKGQANYAAANAFQDAFAQYRKGLGLPACAVDLGVITGVGYLSERPDLVAKFDMDIWNPISETVLHRILRIALMQQKFPLLSSANAQLITGIVVPQKDESFLGQDARFRRLCFASSSAERSLASQDGPKDIQAFFRLLREGADHSVVLASMIEIVNKELTKSLRLSEPVEPAKPLGSYGLDSLAAVELMNWSRISLGAELATLDITNAATLISLCEKIVSRVDISLMN